MIYRVNPYVHEVKMAWEYIEEKARINQTVPEGNIIISCDRAHRPAGAHPRTYNLPTASYRG